MIEPREYATNDLSTRLLRLKRWLRRTVTSRARSVPVMYVAGDAPSNSKRVCLFVSYAPEGKISTYVQRYVEALSNSGFAVVTILVMDDPNITISKTDLHSARLVLKRKNIGFDFAAWSAALDAYPKFWNVDQLLFVNDSVYPMLGENFKRLLDRISESENDVQALVESKQRRRHFHSYFFCLKKRALLNSRVRQFWGGVRNFKGKNLVINNYEVQQLRMLESLGLTIDIVYPYSFGSAPNATISYWRELLRKGFPFIKVQLLKNAPNEEIITGWPSEIISAGGEIDPIERHLNQVSPNGPALEILKKWKRNNQKLLKR